MLSNFNFLLIISIAIGVLAIGIGLVIRIGKKYNLTNWGHPGTNVLDGWLRLYCQKYHRQGDVHIALPDCDRLVVVANHLSAIDPFLLIAAMRKPLRFMIAKEEYEKPILNKMFRAAGCIPVDRGGRVEGAFRSALRAIDAGEVVALFPQGGMHSEETPRKRIKPGLAKLAQLSGCHILPVRINGIAAPGTMIASIFKRSRITLEVHPLLTSEQAQHASFRNAMSEWLLGNTQEIRLSDD